MRFVAVALMLGLLLSGCAGPGPLEDGRWFLANPPSAGPHLFLARGLANVGLAMVYVAARVAYSMGNGQSWKEREQDYQLSRSP